MEEVNMKNGSKIVVAVDGSEESMQALSWCLKNLVSCNSNSTLFLLYVKSPPAPVYSLFDAVGLVLSGDVLANMENFGTQSVQSVMERAEAVYRSFSRDINLERAIGSGEAKDVVCNTVGKPSGRHLGHGQSWLWLLEEGSAWKCE